MNHRLVEWPVALVICCVVLGCSGPVALEKRVTPPPEPKETVRVETVKRPDLDKVELQIRFEGRVLSLLATRTLMCEERTLADNGQGHPRLTGTNVTECGVTQSEAGLDVLFIGGSTTHTFKTDGIGALAVDVFEALKDFPFSIPFVSITCGQCKNTEPIALPDSISADYVLQRNVLAELELWTAANREHPQLAAVTTVIDAEKKRLAAEQVAKCKSAYKKATSFLKGKAPETLRKYGARGDIEGAETDLATVASEPCRSSISDAQLKKLHKLRDKQKATHDKANLKLDAEIRAMAREYFAQVLTDNLLKKGVSAQVIASGSKNTRLTIFMPGANDAVAYQIRTGTDILTEARSAGFKKVVLKACHRSNCADKYYYWTWEL